MFHSLARWVGSCMGDCQAGGRVTGGLSGGQKFVAFPSVWMF